MALYIYDTALDIKRNIEEIKQDDFYLLGRQLAYDNCRLAVHHRRKGVLDEEKYMLTVQTCSRFIDKVSRRHAGIRLGEQGFAHHRIYDLGSRNGTKVNGVNVSQNGRELLMRDSILIASWEFKLFTEADLEHLPEYSLEGVPEYDFRTYFLETRPVDESGLED